jgi:hypothetical protein
MNSKCFAAVVALAAIFALTSCSGVKTPCTVNCGGGGGTASLNLVLAAVPFTPPPGTSILSYAVVINSVSLTPSTGGSVVTIPLNAATYSADLTRLTSDSSFLGQLSTSVPSGTYNQITLGLTSVVVTYCAATSGTPGCNTGSLAQFSGGASAPTTSNFSVTFAANQQAGLRLQLNFSNSLTVNPITQAVTGVNMTAANVLTAVSLPPAASTLSAGQLDYIEDVTGVVTAVSTTTPSVTVQTATRGAITSVVTGSTLHSDNCVVLNSACTPTVGQVVSIDATLNADGSSTMLYFDPLTLNSVDLIEGIVTSESTSNTQFQMVVNDYVPASSGSALSGLNLGDTVNVSLVNLASGFFVDSRGLPITATSFQGSNSATDIHTGQTVMVRVTGFTARSGNTPARANADAVVLRFTRIAASAAGSGAPQFAITSLPPFFGITLNPIVQLGTGSPSTYLDGYTSSGSISSGDNLGIRTLYFGPTVAPAFTAAKIRKN